jgi:hypothetical protein
MKKFKLLALILAIASIGYKKENVPTVTPFVKITVPANAEAISFTGEISLNTSTEIIGEGSVSSLDNDPIEQTSSYWLKKRYSWSG